MKKNRIIALLLTVFLVIFCYIGYYLSYDGWIVTQHFDITGRNAMFYTIYNVKKKNLIVVDGGWPENTPHVREEINNRGGHVNAWFLTHYHGDHCSAFNEIYYDPQGIVIDDVYASAEDYNVYLEVMTDVDQPWAFARFMECAYGGENIIYPQRGDEFDIDTLHITIMNTYDELLCNTTQMVDIPNNSSLVFKMTGKENSIIFTGDMWSPEMGQLLVNKYGDEIRADYLQAPHHGNSLMTYDFYEAVDPKVMLFDAPDWLMTDGETYKAKALEEWCHENDIATYDYRTAPNVFLIK